jgi:hypothetical protein
MQCFSLHLKYQAQKQNYVKTSTKTSKTIRKPNTKTNTKTGKTISKPISIPQNHFKANTTKPRVLALVHAYLEPNNGKISGE